MKLVLLEVMFMCEVVPVRFTLQKRVFAWRDILVDALLTIPCPPHAFQFRDKSIKDQDGWIVR